MAGRFELTWTLTVEDDEADVLAQALEPETPAEHAELTVEPDRLTATGQGSAGTCLHTLDDLLACLTGAVEALDVDEAP